MNYNEQALNFIANGPGEMNAMDNDLASWMLMSGDLLGGGIGTGDFLDIDDDVSLNRSVMTFPPAGVDTKPPKRTSSVKSPGTSLRIPSRASTPSNSKSSVKSPQHAQSVNGDGDDIGGDSDAARQMRLAKNREIARNCRKRKRERYDMLEEEVVKLRQWNAQLENQLNMGKDGRDREVYRKAQVQGMRKLLEKNCSEAEMKLLINHYKELYADFGKDRAAAISYHMAQLKQLLIPNTVSKMTLWSLQQNDEFYDEKKNQRVFGGGIWNTLCSELLLTQEQKQCLIDMRHGIRLQRQNVAECLKILKELEGRVNSNFESMEKQMDNVMDIISPLQQARFLLWIERNQACSYMLNNMWNQNVTSDDNGEGTSSDFGDGDSNSSNPIDDDHHHHNGNNIVENNVVGSKNHIGKDEYAE